MDWIEKLNTIDRNKFISGVNYENHRYNHRNIRESDMLLFCNSFINNFNKKYVYFSIWLPGNDTNVITVKKVYDNIYELIHDFEYYYTRPYPVIIISNLNGNNDKINIKYTFFTNDKLD